MLAYTQPPQPPQGRPPGPEARLPRPWVAAGGLVLAGLAWPLAAG